MTSLLGELNDAISEVQRELARRENIFPDAVANGTISPEVAVERIRKMRAALNLLQGRRAEEIEAGLHPESWCQRCRWRKYDNDAVAGLGPLTASGM